MHSAGLITAVLVTCCVNVVILEIQIGMDPGCTGLITFAQFLFIAVVGFVFVTEFGRRKREIPIKNYVFLTGLYFAQSLANNWALSYNISMPLHMIVKSGSLVSSMVLGVLILKTRYPISKWIAVILVTVGIILSTLASAGQPKTVHNVVKNETARQSTENDADFVSWCTGVGLVLVSVFASSGLGVYQELLFRRFGRHAGEGFFYSHALPLPGFLLLWDDLVKHFHIFSASAPWSVGFGHMALLVPKLWFLMAVNVVTQYACAKSVFSLISVCSSLTVTLVITIRKFISLLISVYLFNNVFTPVHWMGTVLVFLGTMMYAEVIRLPNWQLFKPKAE